MESSDRTSPTGGVRGPLKVRILEIVSQQDMSPAEFCRGGFAPEGMEVSGVARHFRELAEYGALAVIERKAAGGSVEDVYRGVGRAYFTDLHWSELDRKERVRLSETMVQGLVARVEGAMRADTFDARMDRHLTWIAMRLDEQGWSEMTTSLMATFGELEQIRADAEARLDRDGKRGISSTCGILGFPSPVGAQPTPPPAE